MARITYTLLFTGSFEPGDLLPYLFSTYATYFKAGLRDQVQTLKILEAAFVNLGQESIHIHLLMFLAFLYQKSSRAYESILSTNNLTSSDYLALNLSDYVCKFSQYIHVARGEPQQNSISVTSIANFYLDIRTRETSESFSSMLQQGFPFELLRFLPTHVDENGNSWQIFINRYIDIVRHACGFIEKR